MKWKCLLGAFLIGSPFLPFFVSLAMKVGWIVAILVFGVISAIVVAFISGAVLIANCLMDHAK